MSKNNDGNLLKNNNIITAEKILEEFYQDDAGFENDKIVRDMCSNNKDKIKKSINDFEKMARVIETNIKLKIPQIQTLEENVIGMINKRSFIQTLTEMSCSTSCQNRELQIIYDNLMKDLYDIRKEINGIEKQLSKME
uniref:Biogenesis of lysosome-related organelles complex 1 subunit 7 n=1 Tax=Parastrongyloides trichosuri TaxID=131310 RepID=A0A0N4ZVH8_PARTI